MRPAALPGGEWEAWFPRALALIDEEREICWLAPTPADNASVPDIRHLLEIDE
jgi:hypothetical protein